MTVPLPFSMPSQKPVFKRKKLLLKFEGVSSTGSHAKLITFNILNVLLTAHHSISA
jgi:hypothetical protein